MTARESSPLVDRDEVIRAGRLLVAPGGITELRALHATLNGNRYCGTISGYFDSPSALADSALQIRRCTGLYLVPNEVNRDLLARACNRIRMVTKDDPLTADHDITRRRWLLPSYRPFPVEALRRA